MSDIICPRNALRWSLSWITCVLFFSSDTDLPLKNCKDILNSGRNISGLYRINLGDDLGEFTVFCDMSLLGGGWTVIQRRIDDSVTFERNMVEYLNGFGHFNGNFWLGLEKIKRITDMGTHELYIGLENFQSATRWARYSTFRLGSAASDYPLNVGTYDGTAADALGFHNGQAFSTKDDDNDSHQDDHCSQLYKGGWWYNDCYLANLNGIRFNSASSSLEGIRWTTWQENSLKTSVIAVRHTWSEI